MSYPDSQWSHPNSHVVVPRVAAVVALVVTGLEVVGLMVVVAVMAGPVVVLTMSGPEVVRRVIVGAVVGVGSGMVVPGLVAAAVAGRGYTSGGGPWSYRWSH